MPAEKKFVVMDVQRRLPEHLVVVGVGTRRRARDGEVDG
jgi:hypothetical protein